MRFLYSSLKTHTVAQTTSTILGEKAPNTGTYLMVPAVFPLGCKGMLEMPGPPTEERWEQMPLAVNTLTLVTLPVK